MTSIGELKQRAANNLKNNNYWPGVVAGLAQGQLNSAASGLASDVVMLVFLPLFYLFTFLFAFLIGGAGAEAAISEEPLMLLVVIPLIIGLYGLYFFFIFGIIMISSAIANTFAGLHIQVGYWSFLKNRKYKTGRLTDIFKGFRNYKHLIRLGWKWYGPIALKSLLFIVPGVIQAYRWYFVPMIASEHPEWSAEEILERCEHMTEGKKGYLFKMELSFIGWILLGVLTFGIGIIFLNPYKNGTAWEAYEEAKAEYNGI